MSAPAGIAAVLALAACAPVVSGGAKPGWVEGAPQLDRAIEWAVTALTRDGHDAHTAHRRAALRYDPDQPRVPTAAITTEGANLLARMAARSTRSTRSRSPRRVPRWQCWRSSSPTCRAASTRPDAG